MLFIHYGSAKQAVTEGFVCLIDCFCTKSEQPKNKSFKVNRWTVVLKSNEMIKLTGKYFDPLSSTNTTFSHARSCCFSLLHIIVS